MPKTPDKPFYRAPDGNDGNGSYYLITGEEITDMVQMLFSYWYATKMDPDKIYLPQVIMTHICNRIDEALQKKPPNILHPEQIYMKYHIDKIKFMVEKAKEWIAENSEEA